MGPIKVVIYDCDGVLFESKGANEAFYNRILDRFDLPPMRTDQLDYVHVSTAEQAVDYLFQGTGLTEEAQAFRLEELDYNEFVSLMRLEPQVKETLNALRPKYLTAIATNRGLTMPRVLKDHALEDLFDYVVTSMDVKEPKPHPECIQKILERFSVDPKEAVYIGDAESDRLAAERSGTHFAAYRNPALPVKLHMQEHREILDMLDHKEKPEKGGDDL